MDLKWSQEDLLEPSWSLAGSTGPELASGRSSKLVSGESSGPEMALGSL